MLKHTFTSLFLCIALIGSLFSVSEEGHPLTAEDVGAFLDGFMPLQIGQADIAGAVIAIVKDGKLLFSKGYGFADVTNQVPISPESTLFRPGSVSKLFIWTAVMQLVEQGKLTLDRDVNDYLDFKIPAPFGKPITLRDIMTHRPGFEETVKDLMVSSELDLGPISHFLKAHMPAQIFPPGTIPAYSNYASTLAAYIVERISGLNFNAYVEEHLFKPLDMHHSTFRQPLPGSFKGFMSKGYDLGSGEPEPFELIQEAPVGALSASANDMTHFMLMHLQKGRFQDNQILQPETVAAMHARQKGWPERMNAMCLGFYEQSQNGYRVIAHGGDTTFFHSIMYLILEPNVGIFVSYNSSGLGMVEPRAMLFRQFMKRYFPENLEKVKVDWAQDLNALTGSYASSRRFQTNILALTSMLNETSVTVNREDNTLSLTGINGLNQQPLRFQEIAPSLFQEVNGHAKIAFVNHDTSDRLIYTDAPVIVFQEVSSFLNKKCTNFWLAGFILAIAVLTLLAWPIGAIVRKHYGRPLALQTSSKWLRMITHITCLLIVIFAAGLLYFLTFLDHLPSLNFHKDPWIYLLQGIGVVAALGSLVAIYNCVRSWVDKRPWFWGKIWSTLIALACLGFLWFLYYWHLLDFNLNY